MGFNTSYDFQESPQLLDDDTHLSVVSQNIDKISFCARWSILGKPSSTSIQSVHPWKTHFSEHLRRIIGWIQQF